MIMIMLMCRYTMENEMTENGNEMHENEEEDSQELMETQLNTNQERKVKYFGSYK